MKTWLTGRSMAVLLMQQIPILDLKSIDNSFYAVHIHNRAGYGSDRSILTRQQREILAKMRRLEDGSC